MRNTLGIRIKQVRALGRITQEELADKLEVHQSTIARLEQGLIQPSDDVVTQIAEATAFPPEFFHNPGFRELPAGTLLYRKKARMKSADKEYVLYLAQIALEIYRHLESRLKVSVAALPVLDGEAPHTAAQLARSHLGISPDAPIHALVRLLERNGCICIPLTGQGVPEFDAFSVRLDGRPIFVFDPTKPPDRIRFTLSHEIIHQVIHARMTVNVKEAEQEAHEGGSEFLMPDEAAVQEIKEPVTLSSLAPLKQRWGMSIQAMIRKSYSLGIITRNQYKYLCTQVSRRGWRINEPGSELLPPERPRALRKMAEVVYDGNLAALADDLKFPRALVRELAGAYSAAPEQARPKSSVVPFPARA